MRSIIPALSLMALLLFAPLAGVVPTGYQSDDTGLVAFPSFDGSRSRDVDVYEGDIAPGDDELTRNETHSYEFMIDNTGSEDDTYNLLVQWEDDGHDWTALLDRGQIAVDASETGNFLLNITAPRAGVMKDDSLRFNVTATSIHDEAVNDTASTIVRIITPYAVDMLPPRPESDNGTRGSTVTYEIDIINVGDNTDSFAITTAYDPWDWESAPSTTLISNVAQHEMRTFTVDVEISEDAEEDEYARIRVTATSQNAGYSYAIDAEMWCNTSVTDGRTYGITIETDDSERTVTPDHTVTYDVTVTNTGNEEDTFTLSVTEPPTGWEASLDQYEVILGGGAFTLLHLSVTAPAEAQEGEWVVVTVDGYSQKRDHHRAILDTNTTIRIPIRAVDIAVDVYNLQEDPGVAVVYTLTVYNNGTDPDSYDLAITRKPAQWQTELSDATLMDIPAGADETATLTVTIPPWALNFNFAEVDVTATSQGNNSKSDTVTTNTTVNTIRSFGLGADGFQFTLFPGNSTLITFTITNYGNGAESFDFVHSILPKSPDWGSVWDPAGQNVLDIDPAGGSGQFTLNISVPADATPMWGNFTVTVVMHSDGTQRLEFPMSVRVVHFAALDVAADTTVATIQPGTPYAFGLTISNRGNDEDTFDLSVSGLPGNWQGRFKQASLYVDNITLTKGQIGGVWLEVTTNASDLPGDTLLEVNVSSQLNPLIFKRVTFTLTTNTTYDLSVELNTTTKEGSPNSSIPFQFTVNELGNGHEYVSISPPTGLPSGWVVTISNENFDLDVFESQQIIVTVLTPEDAMGGDVVIALRVNSDSTGQEISIELTVSLPILRNLQLEVTDGPQSIEAGESGTFTVKVTNSGNRIETLDLTLEGTDASWFSLSQDTLTLSPGESTTLHVSVDVPASEIGNARAKFNATYHADTDEYRLLDLGFTVIGDDGSGTGPDGDDSAPDDDDGIIPAPGIAFAVALLALVALRRRR